MKKILFVSNMLLIIPTISANIKITQIINLSDHEVQIKTNKKTIQINAQSHQDSDLKINGIRNPLEIITSLGINKLAMTKIKDLESTDKSKNEKTIEPSKNKANEATENKTVSITTITANESTIEPISIKETSTVTEYVMPEKNNFELLIIKNNNETQTIFPILNPTENDFKVHLIINGLGKIEIVTE